MLFCLTFHIPSNERSESLTLAKEREGWMLMVIVHHFHDPNVCSSQHGDGCKEKKNLRMDMKQQKVDGSINFPSMY